jgi:PEGA domain
MKTKFLFPIALVIGAVAGCQSIPPGAERGPQGTIAYNVLIESSPPGARIEANHENLGNTPVTLKIFGDTDGTFHDFGSYEYVIQAFPITTNQYPQTVVFRTGRMFTPEDKIPSRIYFDMSRPPQSYAGSAPPAYAPAPYPYPDYGPYYYGPAPYYYGPGIRLEFGPRFGPRYRRWR